MSMSEFDPAASDRRAWNTGRKVGAKRALKPRQVWAICFFLDQHLRLRDRRRTNYRCCDAAICRRLHPSSDDHVQPAQELGFIQVTHQLSSDTVK